MPVVFLAHSLGDLVLEQALVQMKNSDYPADNANFNATRALQFFGVPNLGGNFDSLSRMAHTQPNEPFVMSLSKNSHLLRENVRNFARIIESRNLEISSFFETLTSPVPVEVRLSF